MLNVSLCPHCNQPCQGWRSTSWNYPEWKITTQFGSVVLKSLLQANIFDLLWRKQGMRGLTRQRITDIIYMNDVNGGPEDTHRHITKVIHSMRANLISVGIWLQRGYTGGEGYSLVFMTPEQARKNI